MTLASINPATGEQVAEFDEHSVDEVERRISASCDAFRNWSARSVEERAAVLMRLAGLLESEQETLGRLMTLEMGKTFRAAREEVVKCATGCRFYAEHAHTMTAHVPIEEKRTAVVGAKRNVPRFNLLPLESEKHLNKPLDPQRSVILRRGRSRRRRHRER